jgi:hypothetical protein
MPLREQPGLARCRETPFCQGLALFKKSLTRAGQIVMIDFHKTDLPVGLPVVMKIAVEDLIRQMQTHGFKVRPFLPDQHFLVFEVEG